MQNGTLFATGSEFPPAHRKVPPPMAARNLAAASTNGLAAHPEQADSSASTSSATSPASSEDSVHFRKVLAEF
uniref:Uncharacterized protein n=1 Tax=Bursaphelenchus xylophilus TaxID=6326 RepID=A0A1I7S8L2_BURXY